MLAHNLCAAGGLSIGRSVLSALRRVGDEHEYTLTLPANVGYESAEIPTHSQVHFHRRSFGGLRQAAFNAMHLPGLIRAAHPQVIWGMGNFGLVRPRCPQAILVHDRALVTPLDAVRGAGWLQFAYQRYGQWRLRRALQATQLVLCQTQTMAEQLRSYYRYRGTTALMPNAVSTPVARGSNVRPAALAAGADRFLLLCLSRHYPHKNLESLVGLFRSHGEELADVTIVTTVDADQDAAAMRFVAMTRAADVQRHFLNVGNILQPELAGYFQHTQALLLPTLRESCSTTYLEALHFGRPVLTSDRDFAREVCGDAAIYFDPHSPESMRDAILALRDDAGPARRLVDCAAQRMKQQMRTWDEIVAESLQRVLSLTGGGGK